jgi:glucosamine-6-phosphate deaminase
MNTASALQLHRDAVVFVDEDAASELKMIEYYKWIQANKPGAPKR